MTKPNFCEEKKLQKEGLKFVVGLDEAGRGPLAGPVVAACVNFSAKGGPALGWQKINDSKKLSEKQREEIYEILVNAPNVVWGVGVVSEKEIDKINILNATKKAMQRALSSIGNRQCGRPARCRPDFLLIDGNFKINSSVPQKAIIKGDSKVFSIAAASIIAKVTRDRLMKKYHKKYPQYGFASHKGYGTKAHFASLEKFGPCKIHRKTFWPVSKFS